MESRFQSIHFSIIRTAECKQSINHTQFVCCKIVMRLQYYNCTSASVIDVNEGNGKSFHSEKLSYLRVHSVFSSATEQIKMANM